MDDFDSAHREDSTGREMRKEFQERDGHTALIYLIDGQLREKKRLPMPSYVGIDSYRAIDIFNLYIR